MKQISIATLILTLNMLFCVSCKPNMDPFARHAEAVAIVKRLVARDVEHPMHADLTLSRDEGANAKMRADAMARTTANCEDLVRLRSLIDVGRPLGDYSPIEKIGQFSGKDPYRYFRCGLTGFIATGQGPAPYSIMINLDASDTIVKVGPIVMKN
jgi:hypothetical protein